MDNKNEGDGMHSDGDEAPDADSTALSNDESAEPIFRSSMYGMFQESQSSKTDACAVFCCGFYLWERNQDLFVGEHRKEGGDADYDSTPTTMRSAISKRPVAALFLLMLTVVAVMWSFDDRSRSKSFLTVFYFFLEILALITIWKFFQFQQARKKLRRQLAIAEYHSRRNTDYNDIEDDPDLDSFLKEHQQELFGCGIHDIIGCVKSDKGWFGSRFGGENERQNETPNCDDDEQNHAKDFCQKALQCLGSIFCGLLCGCHIQLFGMCATAQESRHLRETLPPTTSRLGLWQRDYITLQPWKEYYPSILRLRLSNQIRCLPHFKALSTLSRRILIAASVALIFVTSMFLLPIRFPKFQVLVLYGTFLQPAIFLFFVYWQWNRLDVSFDAIVKYFACGFFICTPNALVYEWLVSKISEKFVKLVDYLSTEGMALFAGHTDHMSDEELQFHRSYTFHPLWYILTLALLEAFLHAFVVAGMTEEVCKYLCFWMVEHPDLEFQNRVILSPSSQQTESDRQSGTSNHEDTETTRLLSQDRSTSSPPSDPEQQTIFAPTPSLVSSGEAITVTMMTVALGFACAENLLYVFVYTPPVFSKEVSTLYVRCLFPIHPMTAALQSIEVCRRDLEKDTSVGIGRILLSAWLLHGFFDFSLMAQNSIKEILDRFNRHGKTTTGDGNNDPTLMYVMAVPFIAIVYFLNESYKQRERLEKLDKENRIQT